MGMGSEVRPIDPADPATWPASARGYWERRHPPPGTTPLAERLAREIRERGPIPFVAFMRRALYDRHHGYYCTVRHALGQQGDFVTSPETHPAFNRIVGKRVVAIWRAMGCPAAFGVVEMGAGRGRLAHGVLAEWAEQVATPLAYTIVEPIPLWRQEQETALRPFASQVTWVRSLGPVGNFTGVVLANELLDAFPVHRVMRVGAEWREAWVDWDGRFVERWRPTARPDFARYFRRLGLLPPEGHPVEVNLAMGRWLRAVSRRVTRGRLLLFDYGADADTLYGPGATSTLRAYRDQRLCPDPLVEPGARDLTADVDFTTLIADAERLGWEVEAFTSQRAFLLAHGWERYRPVGERGSDAWLALVDPRRLGAMRVVELRRDAYSSLRAILPASRASRRASSHFTP